MPAVPAGFSTLYIRSPVENDPFDHNNKLLDFDEVFYLKSQLEASRQNIERLQTEMIYVQSVLNTLTDNRKITIKPNNGQEQSSL